MTPEQWVAVVGVIAPLLGVVAGIWWERSKVKRSEAREDDEAEKERLLTFSEAEAKMRTWLVELNEKLDAENEKLRKDLRAVENLLRDEQAARFDDRREIDRLTGEVEHLTDKVDHLEKEFQKHNITPMPFVRNKL